MKKPLLLHLLAHSLLKLWRVAHLNRQFDTTIGHLAAQGFICRFPFGDLILPQPEILDAYA